MESGEQPSGDESELEAVSCCCGSGPCERPVSTCFDILLRSGTQEERIRYRCSCRENNNHETDAPTEMV